MRISRTIRCDFPSVPSAALSPSPMRETAPCASFEAFAQSLAFFLPAALAAAAFEDSLQNAPMSFFKPETARPVGEKVFSRSFSAFASAARSSSGLIWTVSTLTPRSYPGE
jgi:hypothetical protein